MKCMSLQLLKYGCQAVLRYLEGPGPATIRWSYLTPRHSSTSKHFKPLPVHRGSMLFPIPTAQKVQTPVWWLSPPARLLRYSSPPKQHSVPSTLRPALCAQHSAPHFSQHVTINISLRWKFCTSSRKICEADSVGLKNWRNVQQALK